VDNQTTSPEGKKTYKEWSREDVIACILSPLAYFLITVGTPLLLLNQWIGWLTILIGLVVIAAMFIIIDPKLKALSDEFEKKQKAYLEELDKIIEWKSNP